MTLRISSNGFGRIGRDYLRLSLGSGDVEVVAVNDVVDTATMCRLLRCDSTFGPLGLAVEDHGDTLLVDGRKRHRRGARPDVRPREPSRGLQCVVHHELPGPQAAARAVAEVIPELAGKLDGVALRVPVVDGSLVDLAVLLEREVTAAEVNAAAGEMANVFDWYDNEWGYTARLLDLTRLVGASLPTAH